MELEDLTACVAESYGGVDGARMVLLVGSQARGLADDASDVDVVRYVEDVPESAPPARLPEEVGRRMFTVPTDDGWLEKYDLGGRLLDVDTVRRDRLQEVVDHIADGSAGGAEIRIGAGLRDAEPLVGAAECSGWQQRLTPTGAFARRQCEHHLARFVSPLALAALTLERGDAVSFAARVSGVLLRAVAVLAAVNRRLVPIDEPKWLPWHVDRLTIAPHDVTARLNAVMARPSPETLGDAESLLSEVLDLVDLHVPDVPTEAARYSLTLRPGG